MTTENRHVAICPGCGEMNCLVKREHCYRGVLYVTIDEVFLSKTLQGGDDYEYICTECGEAPEEGEIIAASLEED